MIALVVAIGMNVFSYWNSDRMVLAMYGAKGVEARSAPEYYGIVRGLAKRAGLPMPRVFSSPNPFGLSRHARTGKRVRWRYYSTTLRQVFDIFNCLTF